MLLADWKNASKKRRRIMLRCRRSEVIQLRAQSTQTTMLTHLRDSQINVYKDSSTQVLVLLPPITGISAAKCLSSRLYSINLRTKKMCITIAGGTVGGWYPCIAPVHVNLYQPTR